MDREGEENLNLKYSQRIYHRKFHFISGNSTTFLPLKTPGCGEGYEMKYSVPRTQTPADTHSILFVYGIET